MERSPTEPPWTSPPRSIETPAENGLLLILWVGVILFSSTDVAGAWANDFCRWLLASPAEPTSRTIHWMTQKSFHVALFAVFGWLLARQSRLVLLTAVMVSFLMGAVSEGLQFLFPTRHPASADVVLNGLAGSFVFWLRIRWVLGREGLLPARRNMPVAKGEM